MVFPTTYRPPDVARVPFEGIRLSAVTRSFNQSQRMNVLSFTKGTGQITVTAPANFNLAPQGHYMLLIVDASGVPSPAKIVKIG